MFDPYNYNPKKQARADGWLNPVTGYGGEDDSIENTFYQPDFALSWSEIESITFGDNLVMRGVEAPVKDRLARGVSYITNKDDSEGRQVQIDKLKLDIKSVDGWNKLIEAKVFARQFGGAILYFDYGDDQRAGSGSRFKSVGFNNLMGLSVTPTSQAINFELRDSQRGIPGKIWVVDKFNAIPQSYYTSHTHPGHPKVGEPEIYGLNLHTTGESRLVFAHESRCIRIDGLILSNRQRAANLMWGNSILNRVYKIARMFGISLKALTDTLEDFNFKSLQVKDLAAKIADGSWSQFLGHITMLAANKTHNQNTAFHEEGTELKKTTTNISGLPDVASVMSNMFAAAFGIPHSRLFSAEGGALGGNAAETDLQNYHESLRFDQKHVDTRDIERMIFLLGHEPESFPFVFPELREMTRKERVETEKAKVEMYATAIGVNMVTPEEASISLWSEPEVNLDQTIIDFAGRGEINNNEEPTDEDLEKNNTKNPEEEGELSDMYETEEIINVTVQGVDDGKK